MVNVSVRFIKFILKYKNLLENPSSVKKNFGASLRTFLVVKSSKQQFKRGESVNMRVIDARRSSVLRF